MPANPEILLPLADAGSIGKLSDAEIDRVERRLDRFATALDTAFRIPGTSIRFGGDAMLGLVPAAGDLVGMALSAYIILEARRIGAPASLLTRMAGNVAVDTILGAVPILGSVADIFYKANRRNVALLREHLVDLRSRRARIISPLASKGR